MTDVLKYYLCEVIRQEVLEIVKLGVWENVEPHFFSPCKSSSDDLPPDKEDVLIFEPCRNCLISQHLPSESTPASACCLLAAPPQLVHYLTGDRALAVLPGWLKLWQQQKDTHPLPLIEKLVLFETLKTDENLFEDLPVPLEHIPVGLDYLQARLLEPILEWRRKIHQRQLEQFQNRINQQMADYAMAIDLLTHLTQVKTEEEAQAEIVDLFTMLFFADTVLYLPVLNHEIIPRGDHSISDRELSEIRNVFLPTREIHRELPNKRGFYLRLSHREETVGILVVEGLQLPQYLNQYMNMSLFIARFCGLAIFNARIYQQLQQAEKIARQERDISETMRQALTELVSQLELKEVLERTMALLDRLVPYSIASIYLFEQDSLIFNFGIRHHLPGRSRQEYKPAPEMLKVNGTWVKDIPMRLKDVPPEIPWQETAAREHVKSWVGIPLRLGTKKIGILSIWSQMENAFNEEALKTAQAFANEVTIAIENASLFKEVQKLAITDGLTGLNNRRYFYELASVEFVRSQRYRRPLSALMMDIDYFKKVNDTYGHSVGDQVLAEVAQYCRQKTRGADILGRYGGEEFVFFLPETNQSSAVAFAERICEAVASLTIHSSRGDVKITVSLGVAMADAACSSVDELLRRADDALYRAKQSGRNRVCV